MYVLHAVPDFASFVVHIVLEELGVPYQMHLLDYEQGGLNSPEHLAVNPFGKIPALQTPDGPIFETAAILLWLADRHGSLAPATTAAERGEFLSWFFRNNYAMHVGIMDLVHPYRPLGEEVAPALSTSTRAKLMEELAAFEALAARAPTWFSAAQPSILAYHHAMLLRWAAAFPFVPDDAIRLDSFPHLAALARGLEQRPAAKRAAEAEGISGTFFSDPKV